MENTDKLVNKLCGAMQLAIHGCDSDVDFAYSRMDVGCAKAAVEFVIETGSELGLDTAEYENMLEIIDTM